MFTKKSCLVYKKYQSEKNIFISFSLYNFIINLFYIAIYLTFLTSDNLRANTSQTLEAALSAAGSNRPELEKALKQFPGRDMEHLISRARQYDLVNLTADYLAENLTYARKAYVEFKYSNKKYDYEMWRDYVLPYRVRDERIQAWRKPFFEQFQEKLNTVDSTSEAITFLHNWMGEKLDDGLARVWFEITESRNQGPLQLLHTRRGGCKELNLLFVDLCRSVGIPARHCTIPFWARVEWFHYFTQYYDTSAEEWVSMDASRFDKIAKPTEWNEKLKNWSINKAYAYPSSPTITDIELTDQWATCIDVTPLITPTSTVTVSSEIASTYRVAAYTWNLSAWRVIDYDEGTITDPAKLMIGDADGQQPILITLASDNKLLSWQIIEVQDGNPLELEMNDRKPKPSGLIAIQP